MKYFALLFMLILASCGSPQYVQHTPTTEEPHQVITTKEVPVEITTTLPATEHYGEATIEDSTAPTTTVWEWDEATTTITATPTVTEHGTKGMKLGVSTTVKPRTVTLRETITVQDTVELLVVRYPGVDSVFEVDLLNKTFLYTVTNDIEPCADTLPPIPAPGPGWWKWLLQAVGLIALLVSVGRANRKSSLVNRKSALA